MSTWALGSWFLWFLDVFLKLNTVTEILTIYRQLTRQSSLDRHPYWVFYDKVEFWLFNGLVRFWGPNPVRLKSEFHFETSGICYLYLNTNNCKGWELLDQFWICWPTPVFSQSESRSRTLASLNFKILHRQKMLIPTSNQKQISINSSTKE